LSYIPGANAVCVRSHLSVCVSVCL